MKTTTYNPQIEVVTAIMILILSLTVLTTVKAQGLPSPSKANDSCLVMIDNKTNNSLNTGSAETSEIESTLSQKIKSWMSTGSYFDDANDSEMITEELATTISYWMSNGAFWGTPNENDVYENGLALSGKEGMTCDAMDLEGK